MVKVVIIIGVCTLLLSSQDSIETLEKNCLACHKVQNIPSELIYRRYLLTYSTKKDMKRAILNYLKNPKQENSIMPSQFFLKFPMKERLKFNLHQLETNTDMFLSYFDIKIRLKHSTH